MVTEHGSSMSALPRLEVMLEALVGNRLGARVYRDWVAALGLVGDERVLEVGTGGGACARHLATAVPAGSLTCLEIDPRWVAIAMKRLAPFGSRVEYVCADAAEWARPESFDVVIAHFVLHDLPASARSRALRSIARSLGSSGRLCLREPLGHGMGLEELHAQLAEAGFAIAGLETRATLPLMGETVSGEWRLVGLTS